MQKSGQQWLYPLFFFSGFPALIYQIVWQRALFAIYGINVESVTVVVSAFMLGLGLGSLAGGRVSRNPNAPLLLLFGGVELGIALYGLASLPLFYWVANFTAGVSALQTGLLSFALVLIPTVLMGATLPLLVAHLVKFNGNVGRSVGMLYFVNTLGSAVACFVAAAVTMRYLGMSGSVKVAVVINGLVAATALILHFRSREIREPGAEAPLDEAPNSTPLLAFPLALILSALAGFISLCYEIVWYRLYSYAGEGTAQIFAFVLGAFLAGIAFGSLWSRRLCNAASPDLGRFMGFISILVLVANLLGFAIVPLVALMVKNINHMWTLPLVTIAAGLLGATFPLLCHVSVRPDSRAGAGLSYLYLANIIGSAAGSWLVGFVLMDYWTLREISVFLALLGIAMSVALASTGLGGARLKLAPTIVGVAACMAVLVSSKPLFADVYARLQFVGDFGAPELRLTDIVETRSGVVTVDVGTAIYGGGVFDGMINTNLKEHEILNRAFAVSLFHPDPKEVLIIGVSGGVWSEVLANHPRVQKVVGIEINPGYVEVIRRYPVVSPLLTNPKFELVIDDGRRWMIRNRERKFDLIVMDTIYYFRAHATNLLSTEFLDLTRQLLKPDGILYYNTTYSKECQRTGAVSFPNVIRFGPMLVASQSPIRMDRERWRESLLNYRLEGKPVFDDSADSRKIMTKLMGFLDSLPGDKYDPEGMETRENILRRTQGVTVITDDNMVTEWRYYP